LAASREIGDNERTSTALYNLGEVLRWQGDLKGARAMYQQAGDLSKQIEDQSGLAYSMFSLGDVSTAEGDLSAARAHYNDSIKLRTEMGEKGNLAETQMALAFLSIEGGNTGDAATVLNQVKAEFHKEGLADDEILADTLLARVLLAQGNLAEAEKQSAAAHDLLANSQDFSVRLRAMIGAAQVQAAAGKADDAVRTLNEAIASAKKSGYAEYLLEAQLALGSVEAANGKATSGMGLLRDVREQAQLNGFHLIADKAARASAKSVSPAPR
jgi:tetratricopeptide (TPR) repeat protein